MKIEQAETHQQIVNRILTSEISWWIWQIILTVAGCFFLLFGIQLLIAAYRLKDPSWFIMIFFASNLIILISATLLVGFVYRMVTFRRGSKDKKKSLIK